MKAVFVHGWGCGPGIWQPLLQRLKESPVNRLTQTTCLDFGFFGPPEIPFGHFDLAVGHSFGFLWLLGQDQLTFDRIISINGFTRFFAGEEFPLGTPRRVLNRMTRKMKESPVLVLTDFLTTCGADSLGRDMPGCGWLNPAGEASPDRERLVWGLEGLNNWDHRTQWNSLPMLNHAPLVIASSRDRVVTQQLTRSCFHHHEIHWHPSDCHLLPLVTPKTCATRILETIAAK